MGSELTGQATIAFSCFLRAWYVGRERRSIKITRILEGLVGALLKLMATRTLVLLEFLNHDL